MQGALQANCCHLQSALQCICPEVMPEAAVSMLSKMHGEGWMAAMCTAVHMQLSYAHMAASL